MCPVKTVSEKAQTALLCTGVAGICLLTLSATPVPGQGQLRDGSYQRGYEARFKTRLPARNWLSGGWAALKLDLFGELAEGAVLGTGGWLFTFEEFTAPQSAPDLRHELQAAQAVLGRTGTVLVPLVIPDKARIEAARLPRARSPAFQIRYETALTVLAREGLPALDLRSALQRSGFLRTDTHWSPEGARRVAELVAELLQGSDLMRPGFATEPNGTVGYAGDLMTFAGSDRFPAARRPAHDMLSTFRTTGGATGLFGGASPALALVGTSFSARPDFHFSGFLQSATGADLVNYAVEGRGPFAPMRDVLHLIEAGEVPPPEVLIWEIPERYLQTGDPA